MARYTIEDTTLTALGDVVRTKLAGETRMETVTQPIVKVSKTGNAYGFGENDYEGSIPKDIYSTTTTYTISGAASVVIDVATQGVKGRTGTTGTVYAGTDKTGEVLFKLGCMSNSDGTNNYNYRREQITVDGIDSITIYWKATDVYDSDMALGYYLEMTGYDADGNIVTEEVEVEVKNTLTLEQMTNKINEAMTVPAETLVITGNCTYRFAHTGWDWFVEQYGDKITTQNISSASNMFTYSDLSTIPFDLNFVSNSTCSADNLFTHCEELTSIDGKIVNLKPSACANMFESCTRLRYLPEFENLDMSAINKSTYLSLTNLFAYCQSLRSIPESLLKILYNASTSAYSKHAYYTFTYCYALDEIRGYSPQGGATLTSNIFNTTFKGCWRLKDMIFDMQEDGTPYVVNWKSQTIDLSDYVGYGDNYVDQNLVNKNNSGITADKKVTDDTTYQALKDDPDWYTGNIAYSRYNHDSAVNTINSLPDASAYLATAGGTNTIKFKGAAGSATDGGAINTLTEEEIAVATAKGWTVTFV